MKPTDQVKVRVDTASGFGVVGDATYSTVYMDEFLLESEKAEFRDHTGAINMPSEATLYGVDAEP